MEVKEPKSFYKQLEKLKDRGCIIGDDNYARQTLMRVNYYRLTAYFLPYKKSDGTYKDGTTFNNVHRTYEFDRKLSHLLFSVIEEIELTLRTQLAYYHSRKYGALGYMDEINFSNRHNHQEFEKHIKKSISNNDKQAFVMHHINIYNGQFPLWVLVELMTCGEISLFYSDMKVPDKKEFALHRYGTTHYNLSQWLRCLTDLRNFCAHYARLYYNLFPAIPPTPKGFSYTLGKRIFDYILVLKFLYHSPEKLSDALIDPLEKLIEEYKDSINLSHIGFPDNWKQILKEPTPKRRLPIKKK
ncbi:MAG: Abi family protein [Ruminococcus sp.]